MSDGFEIRAVNESDYDFILRVNEENVEVLSPMDRKKLCEFIKMSEMFSVALAGGERAAFLIALTEAAATYKSENYQWFKKNFDRFLYIDRIVIDEPFRKKGLGKMLYQEVFDHAKQRGIPVVTAEIDTVPYNEASLKFHERMGFAEVGTQFIRGGEVKVSLQAAEVQ